MKSIKALAVLMGGVGAGLLVQQALVQQAPAQTPPAANTKSGPGVQAARDPRELVEVQPEGIGHDRLDDVTVTDRRPGGDHL